MAGEPTKRPPVDDETLRAALLTDDLRARGAFTWPSLARRGTLVDADALLQSLRRRSGDETLTIKDADTAMDRLDAELLTYPLSRGLRALLRWLLRSASPANRRPEYFIDNYAWSTYRREQRQHRTTAVADRR